MSGKGCLIAVVMLVVVAVLCSISSGFLGAMGGGNTGLLHGIGLDPILPTIKLPAEMVVPMGEVGPFKVGLTNTMIATILVDIVLVVLAAVATAKIRSGSKDAWVPRGLQNLFELIIELLYGLAESVLGRRARQVFWLGATIFLFVLVANWMELVARRGQHRHLGASARAGRSATAATGRCCRCRRSRTSRPRSPKPAKVHTPRRNTKDGS